MRTREVRVIDEQGKQLGVMHPRAALDLARQRDLDLVEVAPNATPPVCRLMDYGKFRYEQTKRERESRKAQRNISVKELRLSARIDEHDLQTRGNSARKFLQAGDKVKLTVRFKGREVTHPDIGREVITRIIDDLGDTAAVEQAPRLEGRNMVSILAPRKEATRSRKQSSSDDGGSSGEEVEANAQAQD